jgi:hypothetical protein
MQHPCHMYNKSTFASCVSWLRRLAGGLFKLSGGTPEPQKVLLALRKNPPQPKGSGGLHYTNLITFTSTAGRSRLVLGRAQRHYHWDPIW